MKFDITAIAALITAIAAIIAPVITSVINNKYQLKMKKLELYEAKRIESINKYVSLICKYINNISGYTEKEFAEYMQAIYLYAPKSVWKDIDKLNEAISSKNFTEARKLLPSVIQKLSPSVYTTKN